MTLKSGSSPGEVFARIPLTDRWHIVIRDDGDPDSYTNVLMEEVQHGGVSGIENGLSHLRNEMGDEEFRELLDGLVYEDDAPVAEPTTYNVGHFVCDGCHRTWVARKNQTPETGHDTCPECHEVEP